MKIQTACLLLVTLLQGFFVCDGYAKVSQESMKTLGHRFSVDYAEDPKCAPRGYPIKLESSSAWMHLNFEISKSLKKFIESYQFEEDIKPETIEAIKNLALLFKTQSVALVQTYHSDIKIAQDCLSLITQDNFTYSIPCLTASGTHYVSISVSGDYLSVNDRAQQLGGGVTGLTIYSIKGKKDILQSIQAGLMIGNLADFKKLDEKFEKIATIPMPLMGVGNCGWVNAKADLLPHLIFIFAHVQYEVDFGDLDELQKHRVIQDAKRVYYHWSLFDRVHAYHDYVDEQEGNLDCLSVITGLVLHDHYRNTLSINPNTSIENLATLLPDEAALHAFSGRIPCNLSWVRRIQDRLCFALNSEDDFFLNFVKQEAPLHGTSPSTNRKNFVDIEPLQLVNACADYNIGELIQKGVLNIDPKSISLQRAIDEKMHFDDIKALISHGADVNAKTEDGQSLLEYVMGMERHSGNSHVIESLLRGGIDVRTKTSTGKSIVEYAIDKQTSHSILEQLFYRGADMPINASTGQGILEYCIDRQAAASIFSILIKQGADVHSKTTTGQNIVEYAKAKKCSSWVLKVLEKAIEPMPK